MTLEELIARDGPACVWCGHASWAADLTAEHLWPRSRGGRGLDENLAVACRRCNRARGSRPVVAFARERAEAGGGLDLAALSAALERLAGSPSRAHAEYGRRQAALLARVGAAR